MSAIVAGVLSIPMTWFSVRQASISFGSGFGGMMPSGSASMSLNVTGLTGSVNLLFSAPIWFVVFIAIAANALQLLRNANSIEIPKAAEWITAIVGVVWSSLPIILALTSGRITPALGWLLGMYSAITPLVCLCLERASVIPTAPLPASPLAEPPAPPV